jgi:uncharacterized membrane protein YedE/YeeE
VKPLALATGLALGFVVDWSPLTDPETFHRMLTLGSAYVYLLMASAVAVAAAGAWMLRRRGLRAPLTGELVTWSDVPVRRAHIVGGVIFGVGWAVSSSCPGPLVAQVGAGRLPALATLAGVCCGIGVRMALSRRAARRGDDQPGTVPGRLAADVL